MINFKNLIIYESKQEPIKKVCLCLIAKKENKYIIEFIEYYKKFGIDKIFLYDNNDINAERFDNILSDYTKTNYVKIFNKRGQKSRQANKYRDCYNKNNKKFDWLIFYDIDEFIHLKNINNIKDFLGSKKFTNCKSIYLNWAMHSDNNLMYYDNRTLKERFPSIYTHKEYCIGKSIIRGNLKEIKLVSVHLLDKNIERCNGFGKVFKPRFIYCIKPDYKYYYIDHYFCKSTEEFVNKINRGGGIRGNSTKNKYKRINLYFKINKISLEKINFLAKNAGLNASKIMKNIKFISN